MTGEICKGTMNRNRQLFIALACLALFIVGFNLLIKSRNIVDGVKDGTGGWTSLVIEDKQSLCAPIIDKKEEKQKKSNMACRLPKLDPFNPTVMKLVREVDKPRCPGTSRAELVKGVLKFKDANIVWASYRPIGRREGEVILGKPVNISHGSIIKEEFIEVDFVLKNGRRATELFIQAVPSRSLRARKPQAKPPGIPLNILIIGIDSLSHANAQRKLPKLYEYLKNKLGAFIFHGHAVVGDGTTEQLAAMLAGTRVAEQPEARQGFPKRGPVDRWSLIFKDLKEHGYITGYSEDGIEQGAFEYRLTGFDKPPTDLYSDAFFERATKYGEDSGDLCLHSKNIAQYQFDYARSMFRRLQENLKFFFMFSDGFSHHKMNTVEKLQPDLLSFIKEFKRKGRLNNTMLIIMGDHGLRYGKIRETVQGRLEERLPLFTMSLPPWFPKRYPELAENLRTNTGRLTSWFDVYATFRHMLSYPDLPAPLKHGQSLFTQVPATRTCKDASLEVHWCPCLQWTAVDTKHSHVMNAARTAVRYMNYLNGRHGTSKALCRKLALRDVNQAFLERPNNKVLSFSAVTYESWKDEFEDSPDMKQHHSCNYQIQFETSPNGGVYEATVRYARDKFTVQTDMSRLNAYGAQPSCIAKQFPNLRKYCQCEKTG